MSLLTAFLIQFMTKDKAVGFRTAQLEILDAWLMTLDMSSGGPCFDLIKQQIKLIEKAQKNEDTEAAATCLLSTILAHGASSFLEKNIDVHLSKLLLKNVWNPKKKDFCLESILRILRGQYTGSQVNFDNVGVLDWLPSRTCHLAMYLLLALTSVQHQKAFRSQNQPNLRYPHMLTLVLHLMKAKWSND